MSYLQPVEYEALGFSALFTRYLAGDARLMARFRGAPFDPASHRAAAQAAIGREYPRTELVRRLADYNQELGACEATLRNIDALKRARTLVVCTGQQPGLLTGPLYTVYKAVTALALARRLAAASPDLVFVPVFWCASEDHDLEEMNAVHLPGPDDEVLRLKTSLTNDGRPAETVPVDAECRRLLQDALAALPETEFKDEIAALFAPAPEDTLGSWFNRILLRLFSDAGLVVLEPRLIRDLGAPVIRRELDVADETSRRLRAAGEDLAQLGYAAPLDDRRMVHLFHIGDSRRARVQFYADFCILADDRVDRRELGWHLEEHPERFSPDVALRPILQSAVLPVMAYVAGPGEVAYHAQLKEVYELFDVPMPVVYPRASVTLLEAAVARAIDRFGLSAAQLFLREDARDGLFAATARGQDVAASLDRHLEETARHLEAVDAEVAAFDPTIGRVVRKIRGRVQRDLHYLKRRVSGAIDEAAGVGKRQLARLFAHTFPRNLPQERVYNILYYLVKYGPDLPHGLLQDLTGDPERHVIYTLGGFGADAPPGADSATGPEPAAALPEDAAAAEIDAPPEDGAEENGAGENGADEGSEAAAEPLEAPAEEPSPDEDEEEPWAP
ncbi:MAG: bacillithiol biosynthesis cysteine-adding enzyme BshC [Planctomycetes bacterium]|nr:bacillithiol biosynthesis cysteine-adding enzyme BshC [Planctomycetota bacterium]